MMRRIAAPCLTLLAILTLYGAISIGRSLRPPPDVVHDLQVLPQQALSETVVTKTPQTIDVTVARVPADDALDISRWRPGWSGEKLDPNAAIVLHFVSGSPSAGSPLEHTIAIPGLSPGLYQIRLASSERTAVQDLNVSTLDAMINRGAKGAAVLALDARTLRARTDVTVLNYTADGVRKFVPANDGLVYLPPSWPQNRLCSGDRGVLVVDSDGSLVRFDGGACPSQVGTVTFTDTDRHAYRPGDRVYYRVFSRDPSTQAFVTSTAGGSQHIELTHTANHVAYGSYVLSPTARADYSPRAGFTVSDAAHSRYAIEAAALTPLVDMGGVARFVISVTMTNGAPASGLRVRYAWHTNSTPQGFSMEDHAFGVNGDSKDDLAYGNVTLDALGDAVVTLNVKHDNTEIYVFDPDTQQLVASARAVLAPTQPTIAVSAPFGEMAPGCVPIGVRETTPQNSPMPGRPIHLEIQPVPHFANAPSPPPVLARDLITNPDGYATTRWCVLETKEYKIFARDQTSGLTSRDDYVGVKPITYLGSQLILLTPDASRVRPGATASLTAFASDDGDALVFYGSDNDFHSQIAHVTDGVGHVSTRSPPDLDDYQVGLAQATLAGDSRAYASVSVFPAVHSLRVQIGCLWQKRYFCLRALNWRSSGTPVRLFVDVTAATRAAIVNAMARSNDAYNALYSPGRPDASLTSAFVRPNIGKSYLYPLPSPEPARTASPTASPAAAPSPEVTPTPSAAKQYGSQTILWLNGVSTNRSGYARISLPTNIPANRLYLVHIIALGDRGEIGEAYAALFKPNVSW